MPDATATHDDWSAPVHADDWSDPVHHPAADTTGTRDRPLDDTAHAAGALTIARASLAPDPQVQIKRYAEAFKQPESDFGIVGDHIVRRLPDSGQYARVEPSVSGATGPVDAAKRAFDWVAGGAGPAIPAVMSGVGAAAAGLLATPETFGAGTVPAAMAGGAAFGSLGEIARQKLDSALAPKGEEAPMDLGNVGWQGAAGATGPVLGKVLSLVGGRIAPVVAHAAADELPAAATAARAALTDGTAPVAGTATSFGLSPRVIDALKSHITGKESELAQLREDAQSLGVDLSLGQMTGSTVAQQAERQLARQPEGADLVSGLRRSQNEEQIPGAVRSVMDNVAPDAPAGQQVAGFRDAAEGVVDQAREAQSKGAATAFGKALDERTDRYWNPQIDELMSRPSLQAGIGNARKIAAEEGFDRLTVPAYENGKLVGRDTVPDWRSWQYIKKGIDAEIEAHTDSLTGKVDSYGRAVINTKRQLMGILTKENPEWGAALRQYGESADAIDQVLEGGVGFLNKMSGPDRQNMVNRVFSGQNLMPDDISAMRRQFTYAGKMDEWNGAVRSYVADKLADAMTPTQSGELSNVGGKMFRALWGDQRQADVMKAALGGKADDALMTRWDKLGSVLKAAAHQLPEGSPTATDTGAPGIVGRFAQGVKYMLHPTSMGADLIDGLEKMQSPENTKKLADYLLTPEGDKLLKTLYPTTPGTPKANSILGVMLTQAGIVEAEGSTAR